MAIFEKPKKTDSKAYVALLDTEGNMVAIVNPTQKIAPELLVDSLKAKGLNVELREPQPEITELKL